MVTAYDATMAKLLEAGGVDVLLVGDSLGMVVKGEASTLGVTVDEIVYHLRAVSRGTRRAQIVGDMPFMSYQASIDEGLRNAGRLVKEGGAEAVQYGFASRVCADPYAEAIALARDIAGKSPHAVRAAKRLLKIGEDGTPAQVLQAESDEQILLMGKPNQVEAVKAGLEKRAPKFSEV